MWLVARKYQVLPEPQAEWYLNVSMKSESTNIHFQVSRINNHTKIQIIVG